MIANMISYAVAEVLHTEPLFDVLARPRTGFGCRAKKTASCRP